MKILQLLSVCLLLLTISAFSQEKTYYNSKGKKLSGPTAVDAKYYEVITTDSPSHTVLSTYSIDDKLQQSQEFSNLDKHILDGKSQYWDAEGNLICIINFSKGKREGNSKRYYSNGTLKRDETYKNGVLIDGKCFNEAGKEITFFEYSVEPNYPGGAKKLYEYIRKNFNLGSFKSTEKKSILITFVVEKDGSIVDISVIKGINDMLNNEAIRVIKEMKHWEPGMEDGKPIRVPYTIPIFVVAR